MSSSAKASPFVLPIVTGAAAAAIFLFDTFVKPGLAYGVLYVVVVLMAVRFLERRGILLVSAGCMALVVLSHFIPVQGHVPAGAVSDLVISIAAIGITTYLALINQSTATVLREQAHLLDVTHDAIFNRDMSDAISYWNRSAEEMYGWSHEEALGRVTHELLQTIFPEPVEEINAKVLRTGHWEGELVHTKRDGTQIVVASRWSIQTDEQGRPIAILETNSDITERKRVGEKLQEVHAELARVTRTTTLGELTASIAHEVNQPLAAIVTYGDVCLRLLGDEHPDVQGVRSAVDDMIANSMRASEIIQRLRALCKKTDPQKALLDMNDLISEVIPLMQRESLSRGISLEVDLARSMSPVLGDRVQLQQVIMNLVLNGMEAITAVTDGPRDLLIRSGQNGADQIIVSVQDSGIGINPDNEQRLFDAFFTTKPEGMGMGLSICRSIIELHGGRVWALRNAERGATFQFALPLHEGSES